jgi:general secretion pathway protein I
VSSESHWQRHGRGFTLIETVVALMVVALGMTAVYMQLNLYATTNIRAEQRTLASWIASNRLTELSLQSEWPALGEDEDEVEFANRMWHLSVEISETDVEHLHRADVSVALADHPERVILTESALIEPPTPTGLPPVDWTGVGGGPRG